MIKLSNLQRQMVMQSDTKHIYLYYVLTTYIRRWINTEPEHMYVLQNNELLESEVKKGLQTIWNNFDPIGVYSIDKDWDKDEYDDYLFQTMELLQNGASDEEFKKFLRWVVVENMGLGFGITTSDEALKFIAELRHLKIISC